MTASDDDSNPTSPASPFAGEPQSLAERALDVLVYLPVGAVLTALEAAPETIAKGKSRVDQELRNAKVVGRFAVGIGWRQLKDQVERFAAQGPSEGRSEARDPVHREHRQAAAARSATRIATAGASAGSTPRRVTPPRDAEVDRAIPDYDILAASQVVRRLDGLGRDELAAVVRHERATRARRTILHRAEQLLGAGSGSAGAPGSPDAGSTA